MKKRNLVSLSRNQGSVADRNYPLHRANSASGEPRSRLGLLIAPGTDFVVGLFPGDSEEMREPVEVLRPSW
jgi:hypothetical protein